jgi:hypothetical protein
MKQELVVTVWKDGTWKVWGAMDAYYAQSDEDYLVTIPLRDLGGVAGLGWIAVFKVLALL